jgi:molecular chaperone GrpE
VTHDSNDETNKTAGSDEVGPQIEASSEMEDALREATESLDALQKGAVAGADGSDGADGSIGADGSDANGSPDKLTIELLSTELQELKNFHEEKVKEFNESEEKSLRLQAEFENFRRRSLKEKQESFKFGHQNIVKDLLSAVDNLERALEHGVQNDGSDASGGDASGVLDGVELVHREILGAFAKHGVQEIEAAGQLFDPAVHEALGQVPNADLPANSVLEVLQKGYVIHDRMLRPARVIVTRGLADEAGNAEAESAEDESA